MRISDWSSDVCSSDLNTITGSLIPAGSTITSVTKDGQTYTGMHVQAANVNNAGQGYQVGDILTRNTGGTFTINPTFAVRSVDAGGGILTVNVLEPGDCAEIGRGAGRERVGPVV